MKYSVQFDLDIPTSSYDKIAITIPAGGLKFYINNFRIFEGSNFYFDYTATDSCFMYYDLANMKCLKARDGYAVY